MLSQKNISFEGRMWVGYASCHMTDTYDIVHAYTCTYVYIQCMVPYSRKLSLDKSFIKPAYPCITEIFALSSICGIKILPKRTRAVDKNCIGYTIHTKLCMYMWMHIQLWTDNTTQFFFFFVDIHVHVHTQQINILYIYTGNYGAVILTLYLFHSSTGIYSR